MILFASALVIAGLSANDPLITGVGLFILAIGSGLFIFRQVKHVVEDDDSGITAGVVSFKAPAALVAVVVGALLVLVGRGALTVGNLAGSDSDSGEAAPPPAVSVTVPDEPVTTVTTVTPSTTVPESVETEPPAPIPNPDAPDQLPTTGAGEVLWYGVLMVTGGRWVLKSAERDT